jgi:hypothetical protein
VAEPPIRKGLGDAAQRDRRPGRGLVHRRILDRCIGPADDGRRPPVRPVSCGSCPPGSSPAPAGRGAAGSVPAWPQRPSGRTPSGG